MSSTRIAIGISTAMGDSGRPGGGFYSTGHARIWRVTPHHATVWARGVTTVQGCGFGSDGAIYVSNCSIAPATGTGPQLCPTGGQVVRPG